MLSSLTSPQGSVLLWLLGALVYLLGMHVGMAALREARRLDQGTGWSAEQIRLVLTAGAAWGTAPGIGFVLAISSLALPFALGFAASQGLWLWLGAVAAGCLLAAALLRWPTAAAELAAGAALGLLALALHAGWLSAAGFRPGLVWRTELLVISGLLMVASLALAFGIGLSDLSTEGPSRKRWRGVAATLGAFGLIAGQELLVGGMNIAKQVSSVFKHELSAGLLSLIGGVGVPIALLMAWLLLFIAKRSRSRRHHRDFTLTQLMEARPGYQPENAFSGRRGGRRGAAAQATRLSGPSVQSRT